MEIQIRLIDKRATVPTYAHDGDSGMDITSVDQVTLLPGESRLIRTGLQIAVPPGTEAQIRPRSGLAIMYQVTVLNTPGTIDSNYRGEVGVILINHGPQPFHVKTGMKIAQMVICPVHYAEVIQVDSLDDTNRGADGFGSTGV